jgi:hypothetical protein
MPVSTPAGSPSLDWAAASLIALVGMLVAPAVAVASGGASADLLAIDAPCSGPASTPVCAMRTWDRCYRERDASLCALIGIPGVRFELMDAYLSQFPGAAEAIEAGLADHIVGVREVDPERFSVREGSGFVIQDRMIGTHEVMGELDICGDRPCAASASYFFKKVGDRWVLASWIDNAGICEGWAEDEFRELFPECGMQIPVPTWGNLGEME